MNRLKELRESKNLTFKELSNELKSRNVSISPDSLSKYERGARNPKIDKWQALADYFGVLVPYLQGKIFKEDLDDEAQEMFEDVQDYISYVIPNELIEIVLEALLNSYEYNYESDGWK